MSGLLAGGFFALFGVVGVSIYEYVTGVYPPLWFLIVLGLAAAWIAVKAADW